MPPCFLPISYALAHFVKRTSPPARKVDEAGVNFGLYT